MKRQIFYSNSFPTRSAHGICATELLYYDTLFTAEKSLGRQTIERELRMPWSVVTGQLLWKFPTERGKGINGSEVYIIASRRYSGC